MLALLNSYYYPWRDSLRCSFAYGVHSSYHLSFSLMCIGSQHPRYIYRCKLYEHYIYEHYIYKHYIYKHYHYLTSFHPLLASTVAALSPYLISVMRILPFTVFHCNHRGLYINLLDSIKHYLDSIECTWTL